MLKRLFALGFVAVLAMACTSCNAQPNWVGTWATAIMSAQGSEAVRSFADMTLREIMHISAGGGRIRIRFTNEFGADPLTIEDVHVALSAGGSATKDGTDRIVTFGGARSVRIAPGAAMYSDPVDLAVPAMADVAISFYVPDQAMRAETLHAFASQTNYVASGDVAGARSLDGASTSTSWYFVSGIEVPAVNGSRVIVTLGDSITDGAASTNDANRRWPDVLAARLQQAWGMDHVSVLNEGLGGNRVLNEGAGPSALARFNRDVLAQNGVKYLIVFEGINDIGRLAQLEGPEDDITAEQLEQALRQIADRAHQHGIKVYGATLTPYMGASNSGEKGEQMRQTVNNWIRTSGVFDSVIDFDKIAGDGATPSHLNTAYDSGDHLHPTDPGYKAMGDAIDLKLFR